MTEPTFDIVVCVHNALDDVRTCLEAVERVEYPHDRLGLVIVDDGSDEPTAEYLRGFSERLPWAKLVRRDEAGGYTVAANAGVLATNADYVLLLNSDAFVPAQCLHKLLAVFERSPDIGLVGPLSNAASWQSVPERSAPGGGWAVNDLPPGMTIDDMDAVTARASEPISVTVRVPLLNGFCLSFRRSLLDTVGYFDESGFPFGFGEEDDFCLRAANAGYGLAIATDAYVHHAKSKSYGSERRTKLTAAGQEKLRLKHTQGRLERAVATMRTNPYLEQMRDSVATELENLAKV